MYTMGDNLDFNIIAAPFTDVSQWDEYLAYHFDNQSPDGGEWSSLNLWASGDSGSGGRAGAKKVTIEPLTLSGDTASAGEPCYDPDHHPGAGGLHLLLPGQALG